MEVRKRKNMDKKEWGKEEKRKDRKKKEGREGKGIVCKKEFDSALVEVRHARLRRGTPWYCRTPSSS